MSESMEFACCNCGQVDSARDSLWGFMSAWGYVCMRCLREHVVGINPIGPAGQTVAMRDPYFDQHGPEVA